MKKIIAIVMVVSFTLRVVALPAPGITIVGCLADIFGVAVDSDVIFTAQWTPGVGSNATTTSPPRYVTTINGCFTVTNILSGIYTVSFPTIERDICINVPTNTGAVFSFNYLAALCSNVPTVISLITNSLPAVTPVGVSPGCIVSGCLQDIFGYPLDSDIILTPQWTPTAAAGAMIVSPTRYTTSTNGCFVFTNLVAGKYMALFPTVESEICFEVPTNSPSAYNFSYLVSLCTNVPPLVSLTTNTTLVTVGLILAEDSPAGLGNSHIIADDVGVGVNLILYDP